MKKPKVSVVIPVYKVEPYIEKCVRTLFGQTLDRLELIFVDDCSPDNSIAVIERVLKEYPNRKDQVKLIHHNINEGVAKTRQDGIDVATGEYIIHCDPDDWVELDMYESMYNKAKDTDADIVICDYIDESENKSKYNHQNIPFDKKSIFYLIANQKIHCSFWNKLIKHSLSIKYRLEKHIDIWEDMSVISCILLDAKSIIKIDKGLYHYYWGKSDSLTKNKTIPRVMSFIKSVEYITSQLYYTNNISLINVNDLYLLQWKAKRGLISDSKNDLKLWNDIFLECNKEYRHIGLTIKGKILSYLAIHRYTRVIRIILKIKNVSS